MNPTDKEILDWAERHPDRAIGAIAAAWAICGPGSREEFFGFRTVLIHAMNDDDTLI